MLAPICFDKSSSNLHDVRRRSQVEDQSQTNSCCANAVAGAYEYINKRYAMSKGGAGETRDLGMGSPTGFPFVK
jgi:hypothetical protein